MESFSAPTAVTGRTVIGTYADYADAQRLVDHLSDGGFPVQNVRILGRGLHSVEQVVGRLTKMRAALSGLLSGAMLGFLIGWVLALFGRRDVSSWKPILLTMLFGALWGAALGFVGHTMTRGHRDFASVQGIKADAYEVEVDTEHADQAKSLAAKLPQKLTHSR